MTQAGKAAPDNIRGALWLLASAVLFTCMITCVKLLGTRLDVMQIGFMRLFISFLLISPFLWRAGLLQGGGIKTRVPALQITRGIIGSLAMICGFYASIALPLADVQAISFSRLLFLVPLAALILHEHVGWHRGFAVIIGFGGVLLMLRPGVGFDINLGVMTALGHALFVALASILVNIVSRYDTPVTMMFYSNIFGMAILIVPTILFWQMPNSQEWILLIIMGIAGAMGHNFFIRAYGMGEASAIAPFDYTRLIFAVIVGYFLFADIPDIYTISGGAIIVITTLYIIRREARLKKHPVAV